MSTPTYLPNASLTRTYFRVGERDHTISRTRRSVSFRTFWYLLSFAILVGGSLFTFVRAQATGSFQTQGHQILSESDDLQFLDSSLSTVKQSFQLERLVAVNFREFYPTHGTHSSEGGQLSLSHSNTMMQSPCARRCLDPHPGEFRYWNGAQNGCWIQVWRSWPEGCRHYQWFNSCNGYWDSYPNGAPRVYWDCCVH
jgi:hypothetical protein